MSHAHHGHESDRAIGERDHHGHTGATHGAENLFSRDSSGLPEAISSETVVPRDGASFELRSMPVRKRIGNATMRMLAYNGSIPGPTLKVEQGSEWRIDFTNQIDLETTVHWHGLRLDNRFDGVPTGAHHGMQPPIPQGARR